MARAFSRVTLPVLSAVRTVSMSTLPTVALPSRIWSICIAPARPDAETSLGRLILCIAAAASVWASASLVR